MLQMTSARNGEPMHTVVVVVYDATSGDVHGTYAHAAFGSPDRDGALRGGFALRDEIGARLDQDAGTLAVAELAPDAIPPLGINRIDPHSLQPVTT
jgi:hypothetical protein